MRYTVSPEPSNDDHADYAQRALAAFAEDSGLDLREDGLDTALVDLLADLLHLCEREGVDFHHQLERARRHYHEEVRDGG